MSRWIAVVALAPSLACSVSRTGRHTIDTPGPGYWQSRARKQGQR